MKLAKVLFSLAAMVKVLSEYDVIPAALVVWLRADIAVIFHLYLSFTVAALETESVKVSLAIVP